MKISLAAENDRTVFQKLREAALAYHLTRKWSKERILRNYLNSIYFGNGAYGIESAARPTSPTTTTAAAASKGEPRCASVLLPHEAALLAAMVASPSAYDPVQHPVAVQAPARPRAAAHVRAGLPDARALRDASRPSRCPTRDDLTFPKEDTEYPYFTSWIKQQVVDRLGGGQQGAQLAFEGGLQVKTTIDSRLQTRREKAIDAWLPNKSGPRASLVAISNKDGAVRAMVGGDNYGVAPFNLATQGQRQPGSSFKPFVLAEALQAGHQPELHVGVQEAHVHPQGRRALHGQQLRGRLRGRHARWPTRRRSPTTPSSSRWASRSGPRRSPSSRAAWASARRSRPTSRWRSAACARA